jgi:predicted permease
MTDALTVFRQTVRRLARARLFSLATASTLALGVGACTLMTSLVTAVLIKPLPYGDPDRLQMIWSHYPNFDLGFAEQPTHGRVFTLMRDNIRAFALVSGFRGAAFNLGDAGTVDRVSGAEVTGEFFQTLGMTAAIGRFFDRSNEMSGNDRVVVISNGLWKRRFGANPGVVGKVITLNALPYVVIGVAPSGFSFPRGAEMPADFQFPAQPEAWVPLLPPSRGPSDLAIVGRLRPRATQRNAIQDMERVIAAVREVMPTSRSQFISIPLRDQVIGRIEPMLLSLLGGVLLVLLIACVNAAQLVLARLHSRGREIAVRAALGASRARLAREILLEVALLTLAGGAVGIVLGAGGLSVIRTQGGSRLPRAAELTFDVRAAIAALVVIGVASFLAALLPMILGSRVSLQDVLRSGGRGLSDGVASLRVRRGLIVGQLGLSLALVASAGLLVQSLYHQLHADRGFASSHGITFELSLPASRYAETQHRTSMEHPTSVAFLSQVLANLRAVPGVETAALGKPLPLSGGEEATVFTPDGKLPVSSDPSATPIAQYTVASPGMFRALGTPLLAGRDFAASDEEHTEPVVIINEAMADWLWPSESAVGKRIRVGPPEMTPAAPWMSVVGVVANVKRYSLTEKPRPEMIVPFTQDPYPTFNPMQFVVRSRSDVATIARSLRRAVASVDATIPIAQVRTIDDLIAESSANARFIVTFTIGFGASALLLAIVGMYGVMGYAVQQRRREVGVRRALGAGTGEIVRLIFAQIASVAGLGIAIGIGMALGTGWMLRTFLFHVEPFDRPTLLGAALAVGLATVAASALPIAAATRVEPRVALEE